MMASDYGIAAEPIAGVVTNAPRLSGLLRSNRLLCAALVAWMLIVFGGMLAIWRYETAAGQGALAPTTWPLDSQITRGAGQQTLLVFAHPRCPCTQATLSELEQLLESPPEHTQVRLLFMVPSVEKSEWTHSPLVRQAEGIRGLAIDFDAGNVEAERFGVETSGQTLLYNAEGRLLFAGGITPARGRTGPSIGNAALRAHLRSATTKTSAAAEVFGCPLSDGNPSKSVSIHLPGGALCPQR